MIAQKTAEPVGTFNGNAFQLFVGGKSGEGIRARVNPFGVICCPLIGTYMQEYDPVIPMVLLQSDYLPAKVPKEVDGLLQKLTPKSVSLFLQVHEMAPCNPCQHFTCNNISELNIVLHSFFFPDIGFQSKNLFKVVQCGIVRSENVKEVHQNPRDVKGSGIPFGRLEERDVIIHDAGAYSPQNNQLLRLENCEYYSFWVVAGEPNQNAVVSFHWIAATELRQQHMLDVVKRSATLTDLYAIDKSLENAIKQFSSF